MEENDSLNKNFEYNTGHRERLRNRFLKTGFNGFLEYEILELVLSYIIVRRDCKKIAKDLIKKYGNLYSILNLSVSELTKNKYISERIAIFLKMIYSFVELELYKNVYKEKITISCCKSVLNYLSHSLINREIEIFKALFLNTQNELITEETLAVGTIDRSSIYAREVLKKILKYNAKSIIFVHNHPSGSLVPSDSDIYLTEKMRDTLNALDIKLLDHIIISAKGYYSFLEGGMI